MHCSVWTICFFPGLGLFTGTQRRPEIRIPVYVINVCIPVHESILFTDVFKRGHCSLSRLGTIKYQHRVAHIAYPFHIEHRVKRSATDIKHFLTFDFCRDVTVQQ